MSKSLKDQVLKLLHQGYKPSKIAKELGCTRNIVVGYRYRAGGAACFTAPEPPTPPPAPRVIAQPTGNVKCQWLKGEPRHRKFCNKPGVSHKTPWCSEHYARVFLKRRDAA